MTKIIFFVVITTLVGSNALVGPGTELSDAGVHSRHGGGAGAATPGHDTNQSPGTSLLTDQGATRVTLKYKKYTLSSVCIQ